MMRQRILTVIGNVSLGGAALALCGMLIVMAVNWATYSLEATSFPRSAVLELNAIVWGPWVVILLLVGLILLRLGRTSQASATAVEAA